MFETEYDGGPGSRQTGKTTRALRACQEVAPAAVYVCHDEMMRHVVTKLLGESPRFKVCTPYNAILAMRGMRPKLVVIDGYDIFKPDAFYAIEGECEMNGTEKVLLIHSGSEIRPKPPRARHPSMRKKSQ